MAAKGNPGDQAPGSFFLLLPVYRTGGIKYAKAMLSGMMEMDGTGVDRFGGDNAGEGDAIR